MGRFSDINRGPELAAAYAARQAYLALPKEQKQAKYKDLNVEKVVSSRAIRYLNPFGSPKVLFAEVRFPVNDPPASTTTSAGASQQKELASDLVSAITTAIGARIKASITGTDILGSPGKKFKPARVVLFQKGTGTPQVATSRFTNIKYLRYNNKSVSAPFGMENDTDNYDKAVKDITAGCATFLGANAGNRVSFIPQR